MGAERNIAFSEELSQIICAADAERSAQVISCDLIYPAHHHDLKTSSPMSNKTVGVLGESGSILLRCA